MKWGQERPVKRGHCQTVQMRDDGDLVQEWDSRLERPGQTVVIAVARIKGVCKVPYQCMKILKCLAKCVSMSIMPSTMLDTVQMDSLPPSSHGLLN